MNRSIHFRVSDNWYQLALARAKELGINLSEYIRSTISKDCEEIRMRREKFIKEYTMSIDNYFDTLRPAEKKAIKKAIWDYEIDLDINPDVNMFDIFGTKLEMLPIDRPLSPTMEEEIDNMIKERLQELKKEYKKEVWVLMNPDSELWNEETAHEELERLSKKWWVKIAPTSKTRDEGHGQEWLFIVSGDPEAVREFEKELELGLY